MNDYSAIRAGGGIDEAPRDGLAFAVPLWAPCSAAIRFVGGESMTRAVGVIQWGGPSDAVHIPFDVEGDTADDLLAVILHRLAGFQSGPYACPENQEAFDALTSVFGAPESDELNKAARPLDDPDPNAGGACHRYQIVHGGRPCTILQFQHGPRGLPDSIPGVYDDAVLGLMEAEEIRDDMRGAIVRAREALARRVADRLLRGVLGVNAT
jgi:hypothetical protein